MIWPAWGFISAGILATLLIVFVLRIRSGPDARGTLIGAGVVSAVVVVGVVLLVLFRDPAA